MAISAYGLRLRRLRYGGVHRREFARLMEAQWKSEGAIQAEQLRRLQEIIARAYDSVPFYRARGAAPTIRSLDQLTQLPLLSKEDVRRAGRELISSDRRRLIEIHTGGSTGTPLTVYCDRPTLQRNYAFFERLKEWAGVGSGARTATFAGRTIAPADERSTFWRHNYAMRTLLLSSYHLSAQTAPSYVEALRQFQPALIDSYPSSLELIARYVLETGRAGIRPKGIITSSETLFPSTRQLFERAFGCKVFDQYGSAEMVAFVAQCEHGTYHVNPEFGVVELLRNGTPVGPGETGEVVATGFINHVMPLIRYRLGDTATWADDRCTCGRAFPALARIEGRVDDVVITPEGRRVGRLDPIFKSVTGIVESRIVQDERDHLVIEAVTVGRLTAAQESTLRDELARRLGASMRVDFHYVSSIPRTIRGKRRSVVSTVRDDVDSPAANGLRDGES
jgi:phenylacetate-CoA ligase